MIWLTTLVAVYFGALMSVTRSPLWATLLSFTIFVGLIMWFVIELRRNDKPP